MTVFVDTSVWVGLVNRDDRRHEEARALVDAIAAGDLGEPTTSDLVVAETLNYLRQRVRRKAAAQLFLDVALGGEGLPPLVPSVLRVHTRVFGPALERYVARWEAGLSFTDCTTLELVEQRRLGAVATFDGGFRPWVRVVP